MRLEDPNLLAGGGNFIDDIELPRVLHAAFVRSTHAHARVLGVDDRSARALPGVHAVLRLSELQQVTTRSAVYTGGRSWAFPDSAVCKILADAEVCFVGQPIAMVIAESRYIAEDAVDLVGVDYEELPIVADLITAVTDKATVQMEASSNVLAAYMVAFGDIEAAFAGADHVFRTELKQHRGSGQPIEGRGILVECGGGDRMRVWASTQRPHQLLRSVRELLGLDETQLTMEMPDLGGGFGSKLILYPEYQAVAAAARLLRRSVKWIEDRREHFLSAVQERDQAWEMEIALNADGRILGVRGRLSHDVGAYVCHDLTLPYTSAISATGPYLVPAYKLDVVVAQTNKAPVSSLRGAGYPQACFAMERILDVAARKLGMDRAELRRRNLILKTKMPYTKPLKTRTSASITYDGGDYPACQNKALAEAGWTTFPEAKLRAREQQRFIGIGLANAIKGTGQGPFETGLVRIDESGRVHVYTGAVAMGQSLATALARISGEELGIQPDGIKVITGNTILIPFGFGGFASRQLVTSGSSVKLAARAVADKAKQVASKILGVEEDDLELAEGCVRVIPARQLPIRDGTPSAIPLGDIARILSGAAGKLIPDALEPGLQASSSCRLDAQTYANTTHVAVVEVDPATGVVKILRYIAVQDSGRLIDPVVVEGQTHGAVAHGIGNALLERMAYDDAAQLLTTTLADYLIPSASDVPTIETFYMQTRSTLNPLGAKGVGEIGIVPVTSAIVSAIEDALEPFGVHISEIPVSRQQILSAIVRSR